jgi:hypothetical protein
MLPSGVDVGWPNSRPNVANSFAVDLGDLHVGVLGWRVDGSIFEPLGEPVGRRDLKQGRVNCRE